MHPDMMILHLQAQSGFQNMIGNPDGSDVGLGTLICYGRTGPIGYGSPNL